MNCSSCCYICWIFASSSCCCCYSPYTIVLIRCLVGFYIAAVDLCSFYEFKTFVRIVCSKKKHKKTSLRGVFNTMAEHEYFFVLNVLVFQKK